MDQNMLTALTNEFKNRLRVTWEDENENKIISDYILSGDHYLQGFAMGCAIDYNKDLYAKELLYNYVLYCRSDALAQFRDAYSRDLLRLRIDYRHRLLRDDSMSGV